MKYLQLIEEIVDLEQVDQNEYMIKPSFDENLLSELYYMKIVAIKSGMLQLLYWAGYWMHKNLCCMHSTNLNFLYWVSNSSLLDLRGQMSDIEAEINTQFTKVCGDNYALRVIWIALSPLSNMYSYMHVGNHCNIEHIV